MLDKTHRPAIDDRLTTPDGQPRGYIDPQALDELWFHTGTACNLSCPFCLEGSVPGDTRLDRITLEDARPLINEAVEIGVRQFSFTGGEPFIVKDFVNILAYAADRRPCLVLTNGTDPVLKRLHHIEHLRDTRHPIAFRISIDWPEQDRHDAGRGAGNFIKAFKGMNELHRMGFNISLARQSDPGEDSDAIDARFRGLLAEHGLPPDMRIVAFPDFDIPDAHRDVPAVTEHCMTTYQTAETRQQFMCAFSKMVIKKNGKMRVYACTLVDDDPDYDQGANLAAAIGKRVHMGHHRCYSCFAYGSSCSEL
jgi:sulfatase maturation enzyme AslB (radical SAM superfamily)